VRLSVRGSLSSEPRETSSEGVEFEPGDFSPLIKVFCPLSVNGPRHLGLGSALLFVADIFFFVTFVKGVDMSLPRRRTRGFFFRRAPF